MYIVRNCVFKKSVIEENSELAKYLHKSYFNKCNKYLKLVLNTEAVVCFVMVDDNIEYVAACERLAMPVGTFNYLKTKTDQP